MPSSRLDEIVNNKKLEVANRKRSRPLDTFALQVSKTDGKFLKAIANKQGVNLITEIKPKSPSAGVLKEHFSLEAILPAYNKYASAISVLTDEKYFGGSPQLLEEVSSRSPKPTLCKDFIIDQYQCFEARAHGAEAVLLIVKILDDRQLRELYTAILNLGMTAVVEVQTEAEMERAAAVKPEVILINNRNLTTFETTLETTALLAGQQPPNAVLISASGIETRADIEHLSTYCNTFLIGSSLMRATNLEEKLAELAGTHVGSH